MAGVLIGTGVTTQTQRRPCDDRGRDWGDAGPAEDQGWPGATRAGEGSRDPPLNLQNFGKIFACSRVGKESHENGGPSTPGDCLG